MGYTTDFYGQVEIAPALSQEEIDFLTKFSETRRMDREKGPYYIEGSDGQWGHGQGRDDDIKDYNHPPEGQPSLWCQWIPAEDGTALGWDGGEKFYEADKWMAYLIEHFIGEKPKAAEVLPFLKGHVCNGEIEAKGEDCDDLWQIVVANNQVSTRAGYVVYQ